MKAIAEPTEHDSTNATTFNGDNKGRRGGGDSLDYVEGDTGVATKHDAV